MVPGQGRQDVLTITSGTYKALRISAGVLGLILSLPFAFAVWGVSVWMTISSESGGGSNGILAVTVGVGLVAIVLFVASIKVLIRATRLTSFVLAAAELVAVILLIFAIQNGSNLIAITVMAIVALALSVVTGVLTAPRRAAA